MARVIQWFAAARSGFMDIFVRNNRVLPPVLALLALFVLAWIMAGTFMGEPGQEPVAHRADLAQSDGAPGPEPSPEIENRDVDSYAAYRSKDPFRQILAQAPSEQTTSETTEQTAPEGTSGTGTRPGGPPGTGANRDTDNDGLSDRREQALGLDPRNPDSDNDGLPDGADDSDGDGRPDGGVGGGAGSGAGGGKPGTGSDGGRGGRAGRGDDLLDSGGVLSPP